MLQSYTTALRQLHCSDGFTNTNTLVPDIQLSYIYHTISLNISTSAKFNWRFFRTATVQHVDVIHQLVQTLSHCSIFQEITDVGTSDCIEVSVALPPANRQACRSAVICAWSCRQIIRRSLRQLNFYRRLHLSLSGTQIAVQSSAAGARHVWDAFGIVRRRCGRVNDVRRRTSTYGILRCRRCWFLSM
jgi:hypothetical protein